MDIIDGKQMKGGWFVGDFEPTAYHTKDFEVAYKFHPKGEVWDNHYHKIATEINYVIHGELIITGHHLKAGDIFIMYPNDVAIPEFVTDCEVIVVKTPSVKGDKYIIE